eukprot:1379476-Amorphochlora_amoeboformis.AAC.1
MIPFQDTGRYLASSGPIILYVIRTLVRVEGFMLYLIKHHEWDHTCVNGTGYEAFIRGLEITDKEHKILSAKREELRFVLSEQ